jgi:predicted nucleotidyltransferase
MISRQEIQDFVNHVVRRFKPDKVILFGSYASGRPTADSDVDLMVVMRHRGEAPTSRRRFALRARGHFRWT